MNNNKLGRGLTSLLGEKKISMIENLIGDDSSLEKIQQIDIGLLVPNKFQPREVFNEEELNELENSIKEFGILQPIVARKISDDKYEIVSGERRLRAAKIADLKIVPVILKEFSDREMASLAIIENIQRSDLTAIEEAKGYNTLIKEFNYTQQEVADLIGKSRSHVANLVRLLTLPQIIQQMICEKKIDMGHARALIGISEDNAEKAIELANIIIEKQLSVRDVENLVKNLDDSEVVKEEESTLNSNNNNNNNIEYLKDLENTLFNKIKLKLKIKFNSKKNKGSLTINYNSLNELEEFVKNIKEE